jgi:Rad3-related DNA helicase
MALDGLCEAKTTIPFIFARFSADPNLPKKTCERMRELALKEPGSYFVFCSRHRRLAHIDTTIPKLNERKNCAVNEERSEVRVKINA